jgi:hypothetical protein
MRRVSEREVVRNNLPKAAKHPIPDLNKQKQQTHENN